MNWEAVLTSPAVERVGWALVHFLWQGAAMALAAALILRAMRRRSAEARYIVALAALVALAAAPVATMLFVKTETQNETVRRMAGQIADTLKMLPVPNQAQAAQMPGTSPAGGLKIEAIDSHTMSRWRPELAARLRESLPWLVLAWMLGVVALSARQLTAWGMVQRLKRQFVKPIAPPWGEVIIRLADRIGVRRAVTLLESAAVEVPSVIGWLRPVVLLPASALTGLTPRQIEAILAHELAHIRRHDYLANIFQAAVETLLFYHPGVWWLSRRIAQERENCCDDLAVGVVGDARGYALALTRMEELRTETSEYAMALTGGNLMKRIQRLIGMNNEEAAGNRWLAGALAGLTMLVVGCLATGLPQTRANAQSAEQPAGSLTVTAPETAAKASSSGNFESEFLDPATFTPEEKKKIEEQGYAPAYITVFDYKMITGKEYSKPAAQAATAAPATASSRHAYANEPAEKMAGFVAFDPATVVGGAKPAMEINMDRTALQIAMAAAKTSQPDAVKLLDGIDIGLVKFKIYEGLDVDENAVMPALAKQADELVGKGWSPLFRVADGGDMVNVLMKTEANRIKGLVLIIGDGTDLIYGNVVMDADANEFGSRLGTGLNQVMNGQIDLASLGNLALIQTPQGAKDQTGVKPQSKEAKNSELSLKELRAKEDLMKRKLESMQQSFTGDHWEVQQIRNELALLQQEIDRLQNTATGPEQVARDHQSREQREQAEMKLVELRAKMENERIRIEEHTRQLEELRAQLAGASPQSSVQIRARMADMQKKLAEMREVLEQHNTEFKSAMRSTGGMVRD